MLLDLVRLFVVFFLLIFFTIIMCNKEVLWSCPGKGFDEMWVLRVQAGKGFQRKKNN